MLYRCFSRAATRATISFFDQRRGQLLLDLLQELLLVAARALERALEHPVALRIQGREPQVLQFQFQVIQAEALGDRRVDLEGLAGDRAPARHGHGLDGAHVVGAVGELDQHHAQVAHHREQHLAEAFRLRLLAALELDLVELGDAVDDFGDVGAEALGQLVLGSGRVLDDVMEDGRDDGVGVEMQLGEDRRRGHRVGDVGFAAETGLALVRRGAELGGLPDALDLLGRQVGSHRGQQFLQPRCGAPCTGEESQERRRIVHRSGLGVSLQDRTGGRGRPSIRHPASGPPPAAAPARAASRP